MKVRDVKVGVGIVPTIRAGAHFPGIKYTAEKLIGFVIVGNRTIMVGELYVVSPAIQISFGAINDASSTSPK